MEIKTKFKPNDCCYFIFKGSDKYRVSNYLMCISHIIITEYKFVYVSKWNEEFDEQDCFTTKEEAEQECRRRNGK